MTEKLKAHLFGMMALPGTTKAGHGQVSHQVAQRIVACSMLLVPGGCLTADAFSSTKVFARQLRLNSEYKKTS